VVVLVVVVVPVVAGAVVGGLSAALPGLVRFLISCKLLKPSPSESRPSIPAKFMPAARRADPYAFNAGTLVWHVEQLARAVPAVPGYAVVKLSSTPLVAEAVSVSANTPRATTTKAVAARKRFIGRVL
jgi:hypothetical protein